MLPLILKNPAAGVVMVAAMLLSGVKLLGPGGYLRQVDPVTDSILITGCSSGIGKHAALAMNAIGFTVFAGVRKERDMIALKKLAPVPEKFIPVMLDVQNDKHIEKAVKLVGKHVGENGLTAVFNNAGVSGWKPEGSLAIEHYSEQDFRHVFEINFFGGYKITKAFLPLVKKAKDKGRIIFNTSVYGFTSWPFSAHYSTSKHAVESFADSLRREIFIYGTEVAVLQPGFIFSEMTCIYFKEAKTNKTGTLGSYPHELMNVAGYVTDMESATTTSDALIDAVLNTEPKDRYLMGGGSQRYFQESQYPAKYMDQMWKNKQESPISASALARIVDICADLTPMYNMERYLKAGYSAVHQSAKDAYVKKVNDAKVAAQNAAAAADGEQSLNEKGSVAGANGEEKEQSEAAAAGNVDGSSKKNKDSRGQVEGEDNIETDEKSTGTDSSKDRKKSKKHSKGKKGKKI